MLKHLRISRFLSSRLSLKEGEQGRMAPAIAVAIGGIAIAFAVMTLAVAIVTGFKHEIERKIFGFQAQITLSAYPVAGEETTTISYTATLRDIIRNAVGSRADICCELSTPAMLKTGKGFAGLQIRSYAPGHDWSFERANLLSGALPVDSVFPSDGIMISQSTAAELGLSEGDRLTAFFFSPAGIRQRKFSVAGIFSSNFGEYDRMVAFISAPALRSIRKLPAGQCDFIAIRGLNLQEIQPAAYELQTALSRAFATGEIANHIAVEPVTATAGGFFSWLDMLDTNIAVILVLMGCISGFMLISCILILILQRIRMIGILKAMGARNSQVRWVFMLMSCKVIGIGLLAGNVISLSIIGLQSRFHLLPLDPESYYLSYVPVELLPGAWIALTAGTIIFSLLLTLIPTAVASRIRPVQTINFGL